MIQDYQSAFIETQKGLESYPESEFIHQSAIRSLARLGEERKMLEAWTAYQKKFPKEEIQRELVEEIAWGVLNKSANSFSIPIRQMTLLAAFFSQDAKGVSILYQGTLDPNYSVRALAVKFSGHLKDQKLIDRVTKLFIQDKSWMVYLETIRAIGSMKIKNLEGDLKTIIGSDKATVTEKEAAITSLLKLWEDVHRAEIVALAHSPRPGLRQYSCQAIGYFLSEAHLDLLFLLARDSQSSVRSAALQALGRIRSESYRETIIQIARERLQDICPSSALSAAWLLTLYEPKEGCRAFTLFLESKERSTRLLAAGALGKTGQYGCLTALDYFRLEKDPLMKLTLALGLVRSQMAVEESLTYIKQFLSTHKGRIFKESHQGIDYFSDIPQKEVRDILLTPEVEDQLIRLELLDLLAVYKHPGAFEAIKEFLSERSWGITGSAAALLLTEGDHSSVELVKQLLKDPEPSIRFQAALILSLWGRDPEVIKILEEGYLVSDWEDKAKILEGLGRIGAIESVPFLIEALKEQSQSLRLIAAIALIQTMNH